MLNKNIVRALFAASCIAGLGATVTDGFTAGVVGPAWVYRNFSGGSLTPANGKLYFSSTPDGANASRDKFAMAAYLCKTHKVDVRGQWTFEWDYALTLPAMTGRNAAGVGALLQYGATAAQATTRETILNGFSFVVTRSAFGYVLTATRWEHGKEVWTDGIPDVPASGHLKLVHTAAAGEDTLTWYIGNTVVASTTGFAAMEAWGFGQYAHFGIGASSAEGTSFFRIDRQIWIDNFSATGSGIVIGQ
jgi:hypothetical protein